ncbi:Uma2 family endonuclease [Nannocystaceae bacterium ST9]
MDRDTYLAFERGADEKHELWDGEVYAMGGASLAHNWIVGNLVHQLGNALEGSGCKALPSDLRVRITSSDRYVYPDVTIVCGSPELEGDADVLLNPRTIVEVLSPSTAAFDRGDKFAGYRSIPSVREVLFVSQEQRHVESYTRQADGSWVLREYRGDDALPLESLAAPLPLARIYAGVALSSE